MKITDTLLETARSNASREVEAAQVQLGRAIGRLEILGELAQVLAAPEPKTVDPKDEKASADFILTKNK